MDCQNVVSTSAYDLYKLYDGPSPPAPPPTPCDVCLTEAACRTAVNALGLDEGGGGYPFASSTYRTKGCYAYSSGRYAGMAYWSAGTYAEMTTTEMTTNEYGSAYRVSCPQQCLAAPSPPQATTAANAAPVTTASRAPTRWRSARHLQQCEALRPWRRGRQRFGGYPRRRPRPRDWARARRLPARHGTVRGHICLAPQAHAAARVQSSGFISAAAVERIHRGAAQQIELTCERIGSF